MIPLWLVSFGRGLWKIIADVPLWAWAAMLLAALWIYDRGAQYDAGVHDANARWAAAQAEADRKAAAAQAKRDEDAARIDHGADRRAQEATVETRTETAAAVEKIRYEIRTVEVPASCTRPMPGVVRDELASAIAAANAAGGQVRAGRDR